jgi:RNA polymerase sigma-70 factor (sigma-E family)
MTSRDDEYTAYVSARMTWLRRTAYLLCQNWHQADDLVQATITQLYVHWGRARTAAHIDAYARTVLVREFLGERRSAWARRVRLGGQDSWAAEPAAAAVPDYDELLDLRAALAEVPPRQRATLVLRFSCDLNVEQTARVLGCSAGTVKSQTAKGLGVLRRSLDPEAADGAGATPATPATPASTSVSKPASEPGSRKASNG